MYPPGLIFTNSFIITYVVQQMSNKNLANRVFFRIIMKNATYESYFSWGYPFMNFAIVDDEQKEIDRLMDIIHEYNSGSDVEITVDTYHSAEEILAVFHPYAYTAIFMDIYMEEKDGIDAAAEILAVDSSAKIIFLTSSGERMPDAFSIHAFDYIEKPAKKERIYRVLNDVLMRETKISEVPRLHFISNRTEVSIPYPDIMFVRSVSRRREIMDRDGVLYETFTLFSDIAEELTRDNSFLILVRGSLVNMNYIYMIRDDMCELQNGEILPINLKRAGELFETWQNYKLETIRAERKERRARK